MLLVKMRLYTGVTRIRRSQKVAESVKNLPTAQETGLIPGLGRSPGDRNGNQYYSSPVFLPRKSHAQWSMAGYRVACSRVVCHRVERIRHNSAKKPPPPKYSQLCPVTS